MEFLQPTPLQEALVLLEQHPDYMILAGGTDVVVQRREGKINPVGFLDVTRIPELREIRGGETVFVGAATTCAEIENSSVLRAACPVLCAAAASVGSPQIRSKATVGGNVANASPAADQVPALVAAGAVALVASTKGTRRVEITELVQGMNDCALEASEMIVGFEMPAFAENTRWNFDKIGRRNALSISRMNGVFICDMDGDRMTNVRLCIGVATNRPRRFWAAEELLEGKLAETELFKQAGKAVMETIFKETGLRASSQYKLPVSADFAARLMENAVGSV